MQLRYMPVLCVAGYIHKVPVILNDKLQRKSHKPYAPLTSITRQKLLRKQTSAGTSTALTAQTDLRAHGFAHYPNFWRQAKLGNVTCAWSWWLCGINAATHKDVTFLSWAQRKTPRCIVKCVLHIATFAVLKVTSSDSQVFWDVTPCRLVNSFKVWYPRCMLITVYKEWIK